MKVDCPNCQKVYDIPNERLQVGKKLAFYCPTCKDGLIKVQLPPKTTQDKFSQRSKAAQKSRQNKTAPLTPKPKKPPMGMTLRKQILNGLKDLPPMPQIVLKAQKIMADSKAGIQDLAKLLETDQSIATKVLRLANSAYYGMSGKISTIQHASVLLGQKTLGEIITVAGVSNLLGDRLEGYGLESGDLWRHSLGVAFGSRIIAEKKAPNLVKDALIAGLIHDAGKIVLDKYILKRKETFDEFMGNGQETILNAEKYILGLDHSGIIFEICNQWKIPENISLSLKYHHHPSRSKEDKLSYILHIADHMAMMSGLGTGFDDILYEMDNGATEFLGIKEEEINIIIVDIMESVEGIAKII